ncbi:MAG: hypothetical protein J2P25_24015 [Nocardiopsaceae bacterium]|nr:hypothetical protein [Nocardiopsaceae bacterium]
MVDVPTLRSARPEALDEAARSWQAISDRIDAQASALRKDVIAPVEDPGNWSGAAQRAAATTLDKDARDVIATREYADAMAAVLRDAAAGVGDARAYLSVADELASKNHLTIAPDGSVTSTLPSTPGTDQLLQAARPAEEEVSALVKRALAVANETDARVTARLKEIGQFTGANSGNTAAATAQLAAAGKLGRTLDSAAIPPKGTNPAEVNAWWKALPSATQQRLISELPSQVGWLDGVPATARNQANLLALNRERASVEARLQSLEHNEPPQQRTIPPPSGTPWTRWDAEVNALKGKLADINSLDQGLAVARATAGNDNVFLLGFNTTGNGHGIVAVGNPDTATNTVTYVPGLGSKLSGSVGDIQRATRLWQTASVNSGPGQKISSIYWLNYNAPQLGLSQSVSSNFDVAGTRDAIAGAQPLTSFQSGLAATHQAGVPSHSTVIGHSYGSVVVGEAAARDGMHPDNIITVGSPGVGVDHASQLGIPPSHVWAGANVHDPVPQIGNQLTGNPNKDWFGNNPAGSSFGGRIFNANYDPSRSFSGLDFAAHSSYWDPKSSSLFNMAHIVDGQYGQVSVGHPTPSGPPVDPPPIPPALSPGGNI